MDSTNALQLPDVARQLLVVGSGYIGLELGTVSQALGSEVTVIEELPNLLIAVDADLVRPLHQRMQRRFKAIKLNTTVKTPDAVTEGLAATFADPEGTSTEMFYRVLVAVERRSNGDQLGLEHAKVTIAPNVLVQVDRQVRTTEPTIYAIGDGRADARPQGHA